MSRRTMILLGILATILMLVFVIYMKWSSAHPAIKISTDSSPVSFDIDDDKHTIKGDSLTIRPPKGVYKYRATYKDIKLYGSVDTAEDGDHTIVLKYDLYTTESIRDSLCSIEGLSDSACEYKTELLQVKFVGDHSWAIVKDNPPDESSANIIALHLVNGKWVKVADSVEGPNSFSGDVPDYVLEAIE